MRTCADLVSLSYSDFRLFFLVICEMALPKLGKLTSTQEMCVYCFDVLSHALRVKDTLERPAPTISDDPSCVLRWRPFRQFIFPAPMALDED